MRFIRGLFLSLLVISCIPLVAQDSPSGESASDRAERGPGRTGDSWFRVLKDRAQRGTLHDAFQYVRGDTGKWNDEPIFQHAPPLSSKPAKTTLDDWADQWLEQEFRPAAGDETWLIFRTKQLDDNDRVWIERIERRGNRFTIVANQAIWQGRYQKTFTYYSAFGVNLGKLDAGDYEAKWVIKPMAFKQFDGDGRALSENWPKDETAGDVKPIEMNVSFQVVAAASSKDR